MPEHTSWFTYLMTLGPFKSLEQSLTDLPKYPNDGHHVTLEYTTLAIFVIGLIMTAVFVLRGRIMRTETALVPEGKLTVGSFMENFVETFYGTLKESLGEDDARHFLPIIGTCALFIFFSNALGLIPGFAPPTSNLNVTLACGLIIFVCTHYYGLKRQGFAYLKHFVGPVAWLAPLMIPLEIISHIARPLTLGIRLMVNMFVDHLVVAVFMTLLPLFLPVPIMVMGILVVTVQTYVFCLLATVYIKGAIEHHDDHGAGHGHAHGEDHGHDAHDHGEHAHAEAA